MTAVHRHRLVGWAWPCPLALRFYVGGRPSTEMGLGRPCPPALHFSGISADGTPLKTRIDIIQISPDKDGQIGVIFDPVTRRIEALEIGETPFGGCLLRMLFWPGLEAAQALYMATMANWKEAIDNGWFDGIE